MKAKEPNHDITLFDPKKVKVGWRARKDDGDIGELADSIKRIGQLHPIIVRLDKEGSPVVIAGLRRLRACRTLGVQVKASIISPEDEIACLVVQLEENVKRKGFDKLEVGEGLKRFKSLYDKKHGITSGWNLKEAERDTKGRASGEVAKKVERFTEEAARSLSIGKTLVYDLLGIAALPTEDKEEIAKAKTTRERNVAATAALSKVRKGRKLQKLEEEAEKKTKARAKEKEKASASKKKAGAKPAAQEAPPVNEVLVAEGDYRKLIKAPLFVKQYAGKVDLICTDPPYDLERNPILHTERATVNDQALAKWDKLDIGWVLNVASLLSPTGTLIAFAPLELVGLYKVAMQRAKLIYRGCIIWHKTNPTPAHRSVYAPSCEAIVWATKCDKYVFKPWANAGTLEAHNFIELPVCGGNERLAHPAQKPIALVERLIERHTDKAALVFDPFMGTGTTLVACRKLKLGAIGVETEPKFFKMAKARVAASA